ncbi:MAG TPA: ABC transporter ATP-binding protein [Thermoflexia bacterium]|jgi:peptide/nickel transport system ATP-binding protein|nr:ABC transporter ATP-binding protein [Thermoflexia bacterium]
MRDKVLEVKNLTMHYTTRKGPVYAVDDVSFYVGRGESVGLVGESGCGKTSIAISLLKLLPDNAEILSGQILLDGVDLVPLSEDEMRRFRWRRISMVFQAAMNALNPVYTVEEQIIEAMQQHMPHLSDEEMHARVDQLFELVGLDPAFKNQYPHQYSGGMRQRAVIAMALSCEPDLIIADEPTTALDVIVQDQLLKRIREIQEQLNMAMIYISHDIAVIAEVSDRVGVMYAGHLVEMASTEAIFHHPVHPYTMGLMSAFPSIVGPKRELTTLPGEPPDLLNPPPGCRFHPRCHYATSICREKTPEFVEYEEDHYVACWHPGGEG